MIEAGLNKQFVRIFINNIKIIGPKVSKMIKQIILKRISAFLIVDIVLIRFYLGLKIE